MNSRQILDLLAAKHAGDVFVPECKNGPTWGGSHFRLDAWVMNRSWARLCMTGYEIKVSRRDFVADQKMQTYLPLCHEFYVVAPKGIVREGELAPEIGLMEVASTGNRLITRKKAPHRQIDSPSELMVYILMSRCNIDECIPQETNIQYWKRWLAKKDEKKEIGYMVARKIGERVHAIEVENIRLKKENENYESMRKILTKMGLPDRYFDTWSFENRLKQVKKVVPEDFRRKLSDLSGTIMDMLGQLDKIDES